jgi:hypothetical protein
VSQLDKSGNFHVKIPVDLLHEETEGSVTLKPTCLAELRDKSNKACPKPDPLTLTLASKEKDQHTFTVGQDGKLQILSSICNSATFWPPKWDPFHKKSFFSHPFFKKPYTPVYTPPVPEYKPPTPVYTPPVPEYKPPTPVYTPPVPEYKPPTPVYTPPVPEYKPPTPVYTPPVPEYKPPTPVYKPPVPVYNPPQTGYQPPVPVYKPTPTPVYKPTPTPVYKPTPPVPEYKPTPSVPVYKPPYYHPHPKFGFPPIYKPPYGSHPWKKYFHKKPFFPPADNKN